MILIFCTLWLSRVEIDPLCTSDPKTIELSLFGTRTESRTNMVDWLDSPAACPIILTTSHHQGGVGQAPPTQPAASARKGRCCRMRFGIFFSSKVLTRVDTASALAFLKTIQRTLDFDWVESFEELDGLFVFRSHESPFQNSHIWGHMRSWPPQLKSRPKQPTKKQAYVPRMVFLKHVSCKHVS